MKRGGALDRDPVSAIMGRCFDCRFFSSVSRSVQLADTPVQGHLQGTGEAGRAIEQSDNP